MHLNYWERCPNTAGEIHHRLPRSRGGKLLDAFGETIHLMHLCHTCHMDIHRNPTKAMEQGDTIDGHVLSGSEGRPVYHGTNKMLTLVYPKPKEHDETDIRHGQDDQDRTAGDAPLRAVD